MEILFGLDHVTLSRTINRISHYLEKLKFNLSYGDVIVDSTIIKIGKGKNTHTYSGYKHYHSIKFQAVVNEKKQFLDLSQDYDGAMHDKTLFEAEYEKIYEKLKGKNILADKAYVGLESLGVKTPIRKNHQEYKTENRELSQKRIKIEHCFAKLKSYAILHKPVYYSRKQIATLVKAIGNIINLQTILV